jgi:hypothetical protein
MDIEEAYDMACAREDELKERLYEAEAEVERLRVGILERIKIDERIQLVARDPRVRTAAKSRALSMKMLLDSDPAGRAEKTEAEVERLRKLCTKAAETMQTMGSTWDQEELTLWEDLRLAGVEGGE